MSSKPPNAIYPRSQEDKIKAIAIGAFSDALAHFFFPSIPDPNLVFDYSRQTGFFIDFSDYRVTLNLANTPNAVLLDKEYRDYYFSLSLHEISHYTYCPYDNLTNMKLLAAAMKEKVYRQYAPIVVNVFSDLLIDTKNHEVYPKIMEWELKQHILEGQKSQVGGAPSKIWIILCRCYEILWEKEILPSDDQGDLTEEVCRKIAEAVSDAMDNEGKWENSVRIIARLLLPILKEECKVKNEDSSQSRGSSGQTNPQGNPMQPADSPLDIPTDVRNTFGDYTELPDYDLLRSSGSTEESQERLDEQKKADLENIARSESFANFNGVATLYGSQDSRQNLAIWYRSRAKDLLTFKIVTKKEGGSIPLYPTKWRIGEPIEKLDPIQTLITSPIVVPNLTTKKWVSTQGPGIESSAQLPDMMVVLDSSGSMTWNFNKKSVTGKYHISLLACFAAVHYALAHGAYVSAINFSERCYYLDWTNDVNALEKALLSYQGSGTILPSHKMLDLAKQNSRASLILVITDFEIANWDQTSQDFQKLLALGNKLVCFFIDGHEKDLEIESFEKLHELGAQFFCIKKKKDLLGLVIREVQNHYLGTE